jgi:hypothetical protein
VPGAAAGVQNDRLLRGYYAGHVSGRRAGRSTIGGNENTVAVLWCGFGAAVQMGACGEPIL